MKYFILIAGIVVMGVGGAVSVGAPAYADEMEDYEEYKAIYRATQLCKDILGDVSKVNWDDHDLMMRVEECFEANGVMNNEEYSRTVADNFDQPPSTVTQMGRSPSSSATTRSAPIAVPDKAAITRHLQGQRAATSPETHDAGRAQSPVRSNVYIPTIRDSKDTGARQNRNEDSGPKPVYIGP